MPGVPSSRGCEACRKQKKKCDESKPKCSRCVRLRLPCVDNGVRRYKFHVSDGPRSSRLQPFTEKSLLVATLVDPSQVGLTQKERSALNFFRQNTSKQTASYFSEAFWGQTVHQISESQPSVLHAAIAVGALHCDYEINGTGSEYRYVPVQQSSKAMQHLQHTLATGLNSCTQIETVLSTCLVLGAFSLLQGDPRATSYHMGAGWNLLDQWQNVRLSNSILGAQMLQTYMQNPLRWFSLAESRRGDMDPSLNLPEVIVRRFPVVKNLQAAEEYVGFVRAIGWVALQVKSQPTPGTPTERQGVAVTLWRKLRTWKNQIVESLPVDGEVSRAQTMTSFLDIWIGVLFTRISTDDRIADGETRYDSCFRLFEEIIQLAQRLASSASPQMWMSIGTPLVFCALKCRDWHLRRQALQLLKSPSVVKGKWSLMNTAMVIAKVIEMESDGIPSDGVIPEASRIDSLRVVFLSGKPRIRIECCRSCVGKDAGTCVGDRDWDSEIIFY